MERTLPQVRLVACLVAAASLTSGCLISTRSVIKYADHRPPVAADLTRQIQIGRTTKQWVLEHLSPATRAEPLDGGVEILQYMIKRTKESRTSLLIIGTFEDTKEEYEMFFVRLKDGVVDDFCRREL